MPIPITIFLSHADEDRSVAKQIAVEMKKHGVNVFVAHDDIEVGTVDWENLLKDNIINCDNFVVLLTDNFHKANYTDHEVGIAFALKKRIFPIRFDDTPVYGFLAKIQAKKISHEIKSDQIESLVNTMIAYSDEGRRNTDGLIENLRTAGSYDDANSISFVLFEKSKLLPEQINNIARVFLENNQVREAMFGCRNRCLELFTKNWSILEPDLKEKLKPDMR